MATDYVLIPQDDRIERDGYTIIVERLPVRTPNQYHMRIGIAYPGDRLAVDEVVATVPEALLVGPDRAALHAAYGAWVERRAAAVRRHMPALAAAR